MKKAILNRDNEIKCLEESIKHGNVILHGKKGVGKTTIVKAYAELNGLRLHEINMVEVNRVDVESINVYPYIDRKNKYKFMVKNVWMFSLKYLLPIFLAFWTIITSIFLSPNIQISTCYKVLIAAFPLIALSFYIFLLFVLYFTKREVKLILISEVNFHNDPQSLTPFIYKLTKVYKGCKYIFEDTNEIEESIRMKFELIPVEINTGSGPISHFKYKLETIRARGVNSENNNWFNKMWNYIVENISENINDIISLIHLFTFREMEDMMIQFENSFFFLKGELNIYDYILIFYLRSNQPSFIEWIRINKKELCNNKIQQRMSKDNKHQSYNTFIKYTEKIEELNDYDLKQIIENRKWFTFKDDGFSTADEKNFFYSFDDIEFFENYFNVSSFNFLYGDLINQFQNDPVEFINMINEGNVSINKINFKHFMDIEIFDFINKLKKLNEDEVIKINKIHTGFWSFYPSNLFASFLRSRGNREQQLMFISKLSIEYKPIFARIYYEEDWNINSKADFYNEVKSINMKENNHPFLSFFRLSEYTFHPKKSKIYFPTIAPREYINELIEKKWYKFLVHNFLSYRTAFDFKMSSTKFLYQVNFDLLGVDLALEIVDIIEKYGDSTYPIIKYENGADVYIRGTETDLKDKSLDESLGSRIFY